MASGTGKTITAGLDAFNFRKEYPNARVLFLCHQNRILDHARSEFEAIHGSQHSYGFYTGEEKTAHDTEFLFASFQTMRRHCKRFRPDAYDIVYVDESHHTWAETFLDVADYWRPKTMVGMTATPDRTDGQDIRRFFGKEVFSLPLDEALAHDILTPVDYRLLSDEIELKRVVESPGERWSLSKLNRSIFIPRRDEEIARIIKTHADKLESPRIIIFCESVAHCDHLAKYVEGSMPFHCGVSITERIVRLEMFRQGMINTLVTRDIFNEGIDIPQANIVVFLRGTKSPVIFLQQLGRGLRKSDGKDKVTVLDFVGNCERIRMIHDLWQAVEKKRKELVEKQKCGKTSRPVAQNEPLMLNINTSGFKEKILRVLDILGKVEFYPTVDEASKAAIALGINGRDMYREKYISDPRLPSSPETVYKSNGWVSWGKFLNTGSYENLEEAKKVALIFGFKGCTDYRKNYEKDPRLPGNPALAYPKEWKGKGWAYFLNTGRSYVHNPYPTCAEASASAQRLEIKSSDEYDRRYKKDPRLPSDPLHTYPIAEFVSWGMFLGTGYPKFPKPGSKYRTWQEAGRSAQGMGIQSSTHNSRVYKTDPRLPANPREFYKDCPPWDVFLGKQ